MTDGVILPGAGDKVETLQQPDGQHRQVIALGATESAALIAALRQLVNPPSFDPSVGAQRVYIPANVNAGPVSVASGTINTVSNLANIAAIGGVAANSLASDIMLTAWALSVRARITS
jgi:hypothetical protein